MNQLEIISLLWFQLLMYSTVYSEFLIFILWIIDLQMLIGLALFTAIINALVHPKDDEYNNLGD